MDTYIWTTVQYGWNLKVRWQQKVTLTSLYHSMTKKAMVCMIRSEYSPSSLWHMSADVNTPSVMRTRYLNQPEFVFWAIFASHAKQCLELSVGFIQTNSSTHGCRGGAGLIKSGFMFRMEGALFPTSNPSVPLLGFVFVVPWTKIFRTSESQLAHPAQLHIS